MADFLRLRHQRKEPKRQDRKTTIWANASGVLMQQDEDGASTELAAGGNGGSQPVELVTMTYAFDDGTVTLTEMNPGDDILQGWANVSTPFNGTSDDIVFYVDNDLGTDVGYMQVFNGNNKINGLSPLANQLPDPWNLVMVLKDDAAFGPPTSTAGIAEVRVAILRLGGVA